MKRGWVIGGLVAVLVLVVFGAMGPSPMPPPGPLGGKVVAPSAERAAVVRSTGDWLAGQAHGKAIQFYNATWEGGQSATGPYPQGTAFYTGFKGVVLVGYWPFVLPYGGTVNANPIDGYRVQAHLDGLAAATGKPESLGAWDTQKALALLKPGLAASGVTVAYDFADMTSWASVTQEPGGSLAAKGALPPGEPGAPAGEIVVTFARGPIPIRVIVALPAK